METPTTKFKRLDRVKDKTTGHLALVHQALIPKKGPHIYHLIPTVDRDAKAFAPYIAIEENLELAPAPEPTVTEPPPADSLKATPAPQPDRKSGKKK